MATIRKRGDKWRVEIYKNDVRKSKTCATKAEATLCGAQNRKWNCRRKAPQLF